MLLLPLLHRIELDLCDSPTSQGVCECGGVVVLTSVMIEHGKAANWPGCAGVLTWVGEREPHVQTLKDAAGEVQSGNIEVTLFLGMC